MSQNKIEIVIAVDSKTGQASINGITRDLENLGSRGKASMDGLTKAAGTLAAGFAAWEVSSHIKDATLAAARYETLGVVMAVVGNNAGYTRQQMDQNTKSLQANGIAMVESRTVLTRMAQAHLDLSKSSELARVAQDAAVIGNINSSEAFERMVTGIKSGEVEILRTIGINVNFEQSYRTLEQQLGKHKGTLTETEKTQARMNETMRGGVGIAGAYEASMSTAGKQILSMQRYIDDLEVKAGEAFGPATSVLVMAVTAEIKKMQEEVSRPEAQEKFASWANSFAAFGKGAVEALQYAPDVLGFVDKWGGQILTIVAGIKAAELAQIAYNSAVLKNPYIIAATAGVVISQQMKKSQGGWQAGVFDQSTPMSPALLSNGSNGDEAMVILSEERILNYQAQKAKAYAGVRAAAEASVTVASQAEINKQENADEKHLKDALDRIQRRATAEEKAYSDWTKLAEEKAKKDEALSATMAQITLAAMPAQERAVESLRREYNGLYGQVLDLYDAGMLTEQQALALEDKLGASASIATLKIASDHATAAHKVETVWDSALKGIDTGFDEWVRSGSLTADSLTNVFGSAIRGITADWLKGMATMSQSSAQMKSIGGTAAVYSTIAGGQGSGYGGLLSGGVGIANELFNPGSYSAALASLQKGAEITLAKFGAEGMADSLHLMSSSAFGAATAGVGTFITGLLSGQDFAQSAASGAGAAGGFVLGNMILPGIGGIIGSIGGSFLGNLFGGGGENEFTLSELSGKTDNTWDRNAGFTAGVANKNQGNAWYGPIEGAYVGGMNEVQKAFNSQVAGLKSQMSATAWDSFAAALELQRFDDTNGGRWGVSGAEGAVTDAVTKYAATLTTGLNAALMAALPTIANELTGSSSAYALLTDGMQAAIKTAIGGSSFGTDQLGQLQTYLAQISQATAPIGEIMATHGLSDYELSLRSINQQFDTYSAQLKAAGIDLAKYTDLETARGWAIQKVYDEMEAKRAEEQLAVSTTALNNSFAAERNRLTETHASLLKDYNADLSTVNATVNDLQSYVSALHSAKQGMDLGTDAFAKDQFASASATLSSVLSAVRAGDFSTLGQLNDSLSVVAKPNQELYASFTDYQRDYWKSYLSLAEIESLTGNQLSAEEQVAASLQQQIDIESTGFADQIGLLDSQLNALLGINTNVVSLFDAISGYTSARDSVEAASVPTASGAVPGYASGGWHAGGWRRVGENGPELEYTGPSRIYSNSQSNALVDTSALVAEVKLLRAEVQSLQRGNYELAKNTAKFAKLAERWEYDGMPPVRG